MELLLVKWYKRIGPKLLQKWNTAKLNLVKYPKIERHLNKFFYDGAEEKINHPLVNLLYYNSEDLVYLNNGLSLLAEANINKQSIIKLTNRLTNYLQCNSAIQEIVSIYCLSWILGERNILIEPTTEENRLPDISINLLEKNIILEIVALNNGKPVEKIIEISKNIGTYINKLNTGDCNYSLRLGIDNTQLIVNKKKEIEIKESADFFCEYFDKLNLQLLMKQNAKINFPVTYNPEANILEDETLQESIKSNNIKMDNDLLNPEWLSQTKTKLYLKSPFIFFENAIDDSDSQFIEINIPEFDTTDETPTHDPLMGTAIKTRISIRNHLKRVIEEKYKERKQYDKKLPFILVIHIENYRYDFERDICDFYILQEHIRDKIKNYEYLSGVILYSTYVNNGRYIENTRSNHRVTETELMSFGILNYRPYELSFTKPELSYDRKYSDFEMMEKIFYAIHAETEIYLREDIISLISFMNDVLEYFIRNKDINLDNHILEKFESILSRFYIDYRDIEVDENPIPKTSSWIQSNSILYELSRCYMKLLYLRPTLENISLISQLSNFNFQTKFGIGTQLKYLVDINLGLSIKIARKLSNDRDWRIWQSLIKFMVYLNKNYDDQKVLTYYEEIILKFGNCTLTNDELHDELLESTVDIIVNNAFRKDSEKYLKLFERIILNQSLNRIVKTRIGWTLRSYVLDPNLTEKLCGYYCKLIDTGDYTIADSIAFFLLFYLVQNKKSLYPYINEFLVLLSNKEMKKTDENMQLYLLDYLETFNSECKEFALVMLKKIVDKNPFLVNQFNYATRIAKYIEFSIKNGSLKENRDTINSIIDILNDGNALNINYMHRLLNMKENV